MDPEVLINEVYARPPLWDRSSPAHSNRDVVAGLWKEVADACGISSEVAKSKWKHLRDHFRCELKRCVKSKAGRAGRYRSSWVWFWPLVFLKDQMLQSRVADEAGDDTSAASGGDENPADGGVKVEAGSKRRRAEPPERDFLVMEEALPPAPCDDTDHFLLSLAPAVRALPLPRQMLLRLKIQELVSNEVIASHAHPPLDIPDIDDAWTPAEADVHAAWESPKK